MIGPPCWARRGGRPGGARRGSALGEAPCHARSAAESDQMTNAHQKIELFDALPQLSVRAASLFGQVAADDRFAVVLCGGSTPERLYSVLAGRPEFRDRLPWDRTHFFWGDERHVPP